MRLLGLLRLALFLLLLSGIPLQAGSVYRITWNVVTAMVYDDPTNLGAFTIGDGSAVFQGGTVTGNFTWTMNFPLGVLQPGSLEPDGPSTRWDSGTGPDAFAAHLFIPLPDGAGGYSIQKYVIDATNFEYASLLVRDVAGEVRFNGGPRFQGRFSSTATMTMSGIITPGVAGGPDTALGNATIRDGPIVVQSRLSGTAMVIPEPATGFLTAVAGALLLIGVRTGAISHEPRK